MGDWENAPFLATCEGGGTLAADPEKAKMKGNEGPQGQKLENGAGLGAAKFFVWEIGKTNHFWQLGGGGGDPRS